MECSTALIGLGSFLDYHRMAGRFLALLAEIGTAYNRENGIGRVYAKHLVSFGAHFTVNPDIEIVLLCVRCTHGQIIALERYLSVSGTPVKTHVAVSRQGTAHVCDAAVRCRGSLHGRYGHRHQKRKNQG